MSGEGEERSWVRWVLPAVLGVLALALVVTSVVLVRDRTRVVDGGLRPQPEPADLRAGGLPDEDGVAAQAVVVARRVVASIYSLDYTRLAADVRQAQSYMTVEYGSRFQAQLRTDDPRREQVVLTASLPADGTGTQYLTASRAVVLVSVDVSAARGGQDPGASTPRRYRVAVDLVRPDDAWLVSDVTRFGAGR